MTSIACVVGTRPEALKMAPLIRLLRRTPQFDVKVIATGQHQELLHGAMKEAGIAPDVSWNVMRADQTLSFLTARLLEEFATYFTSHQTSFVLAQGDTTSVFCAALSCFYHGIGFGHVEAGLRTGNLKNPFPEEMNRRVASLTANLHFAPTQRAAQTLLAEGIDPNAVVVTGNTIIDQLRHLDEAPEQFPLDRKIADGRRLLLLTVHRRENFGEPAKDILLGVADAVKQHQDCMVLYPVHPNPRVHDTAHQLLDDSPQFVLTAPLSHANLAAYLRQSTLVITDSGGLQEEAPYFRKPVLVTRNETERQEGTDAGVARLVGTSRVGVRDAVLELLGNATVYAQMANGISPFGDGFASERIVERLVQHFGFNPHRSL